MGNVRDAAVAVLVGAQSGTVSRAVIDGLAAAVLDRDEVRLALAVRAGGEHAIRRAIELAALVLATSVAASDARTPTRA